MTIQKALIWAGIKLKKTSSSPSLDSEVLLCFVLKKPRFFILANQDNNLTTKQYNKFKNLIRKRAHHWPLAYLTGHKEFFGLDFKVTKDVLIPRPETELLVERAVSSIKYYVPSIKNIIDIGTGSGNIIITLAKNLRHKNINFFAIDSSKKALAIARANAREHGVSKKIKFLEGNLLSPILNTKYLIQNTLIVANLPYGWSEWKNNTSAETQGLKFEPKQALFTDEKGLKHIHALFKQLLRKSFNSYIVLLEFDPRQKTKIKHLARKYFPKAQVEFHKDLSGLNRVAEIHL